MRAIINKTMLAHAVLLFSASFINTCQCMLPADTQEILPYGRKKLNADETTLTKRRELNYSKPELWQKIAPSLTILDAITPNKSHYLCHHYALEKALKLPNTLRFIENTDGMSIGFTSRYFEQTNNPQKNDLALYEEKINECNFHITHFAVVKNLMLLQSKWGSHPNPTIHEADDCPIRYGDIIMFFTLKKEYLSNDLLFMDIDNKTSKYINQLQSKKAKLSSESTSSSKLCDLYERFNEILYKLRQYPLSDEKIQTITDITQDM